jgi:hypothetical protein
MKHLSLIIFYLIAHWARQCLAVSLTGAVSSKKVTEEYKGQLTAHRNRSVSTNAKAGLTVRMIIRSDAKAGISDPPSGYDLPAGLNK